MAREGAGYTSDMRDGWIIVIILIIAVAVGGILFLFGGAEFHPGPLGPSLSAPAAQHDGYVLIASGADAKSVTQRVNYRITTGEQFDALWELAYPSKDVPEPTIDFSRVEVLAVFDGSHSAGGYGVTVNSVKEQEGRRVVDITHIEPDGSCALSGSATSPFVILQVPNRPFPSLTRSIRKRRGARKRQESGFPSRLRMPRACLRGRRT